MPMDTKKECTKLDSFVPARARPGISDLKSQVLEGLALAR